MDFRQIGVCDATSFDFQRNLYPQKLPLMSILCHLSRLDKTILRNLESQVLQVLYSLEIKFEGLLFLTFDDYMKLPPYDTVLDT